VHPCNHHLKRLTDVLVDVYNSNCYANQPTFPSLPLSLPCRHFTSLLFSSSLLRHLSRLIQTSPSHTSHTHIRDISHLPHLSHITSALGPTIMSAKTVKKDKEEVTPRSTLTHIGNWKLGPTLGRGAYGMSVTFNISALTLNRPCPPCNPHHRSSGRMQDLTGPLPRSDRASDLGSECRCHGSAQGSGAAKGLVWTEDAWGG